MGIIGLEPTTGRLKVGYSTRFELHSLKLLVKQDDY